MACGVLVVEDDIDLQQMMADLLALEGFEPRLASNGREALNALRSGEHPHVILLDLMMPIMDGWQFRAAQRQLETGADIPVIVVSAVPREQTASLGATAFLQKPLDFDQLLTTVRAYC